MYKEVVTSTIEAVDCKYRGGLIPVWMCVKCPYFGGYSDLKR